MSALGWLALGTALLLAPMASASMQRGQSLAARGRLVLRTTPTRVVRAPRWDVAAGTASVGAAVLGGLAGGPVLGLAAVAAAGTLAWLGLRAQRARAEQWRAADLLTATRLVVAELAAGAQPAAALSAAAAVPTFRETFGAAASAVGAGTDPVLSGAELAGLGHAWRMAAVTGAPLAAVLARVADDLADQAEQRRAVAAALAGPRASAGLLAGLPVLGVLLGVTMQAHPINVLVATSAGRLLCLAGVLLDCAGLVWTARLAARAMRE